MKKQTYTNHINNQNGDKIMKSAKDIINYFEGHENDTTELVTCAHFLDSIGWDFTSFYEGWKEGKYSGQHYTKEELRSYGQYLRASKVYILIQSDGDGYATYYGMYRYDHNETTEYSEPTGDDEKTIADIIQNIDSFSKA
jgi:hypothetical protein